MAFSSNSSGGPMAEINVTPLVDVMLVLLIIFMVVTPALASGFTAEPPSGINLKAHPEADDDQVLGIDKFGNFYLCRTPGEFNFRLHPMGCQKVFSYLNKFSGNFFTL